LSHNQRIVWNTASRRENGGLSHGAPNPSRKTRRENQGLETNDPSDHGSALNEPVEKGKAIDTSTKFQTYREQNKTIATNLPVTSTVTPTTQQGTIHNIEKTVSEKVITSNDWLSVSITLWPVAFAR
jgi:hypothetical protein